MQVSWLGQRVINIATTSNKVLMSAKEAKTRIKINKLLEEAGWRFSIMLPVKPMWFWSRTSS
jgi:hypothetical protein